MLVELWPTISGQARGHGGLRSPQPGGQDRGTGTGHVVPRGAVGELCTRGYSVMLGYWDESALPPGRPSTTRAGCTPAIWRLWTPTVT